jgi:hypothetical protein
MHVPACVQQLEQLELSLPYCLPQVEGCKHGFCFQCARRLCTAQARTALFPPRLLSCTVCSLAVAAISSTQESPNAWCAMGSMHASSQACVQCVCSGSHPVGACVHLCPLRLRILGCGCWDCDS